MTSIEEFYGRRVALYDRIATAPGISRWRRTAARRVARPGSTVVEMGCGTGVYLPYLREDVGVDGRVLGIDITGPLLERARTRAAEYENVDVVLGDATDPPIEDADAILATFVCGLFSDPGRVVDRWCDFLAPGGRIGLLNATASVAPLGRLFNPAFRTFVAAGAPDCGFEDVLRAPLGNVETALSRRVDTARAALADRTIDRRYETFGLGFVGLLTGTVTGDRGQ